MTEVNYSSNTRNAAYAELLAKSGAENCVLCPERYLKTSAQNVLEVVGIEIEAWRLTKNSYPYPNVRDRVDGTTPTLGHLMILPARHITNPAELSERDSQGYKGWERIEELFTLAREEHGAHLGGLCLRYYDETAAWPEEVTRANGHKAAGLTVAHFHAHILVPELDPKTGLAIGHPDSGQTAVPHAEIHFPIG